MSTKSRAPAAFDADERFLGVGTVAAYFDVTDVTIKNWVNDGKLLAARTPGGHRRVSVSSVVALLEDQGRAVPSELVVGKPLALVLERDDSLSKHLKRHLGARAQVVVVKDDYGALLAVSRGRPSVIVIDLEAPKLDAKRFVIAFRSEPSLSDIDVVALAPATTAKLARGWGETADGQGLLYFYRRTEKEAITASVSAILDRRKLARTAQAAS